MWYTLQDDIYIVGCDAAWGQWRHPRWISLKMRNDQKTAEIENFDARIWHKHFAAFCRHFVFFHRERGKDPFSFKKGLTTHTYDNSVVTIATDSYQTCVEMRVREMRIAAENGRCWW